MSNLVIERSNTFGSINPQKRFRMIPGIAESSTIGYDNLAAQKLLAISERTNSEIVVPKHNPHLFQDSQKAINELRKTSGLTWEQVAKLFNVSRRSIHFWASGQPLASDNEEKLNRLLGVIRYIDRGSASLNRKLLLNPNADGELPLDQLISGEYDKVANGSSYY